MTTDGAARALVGSKSRPPALTDGIAPRPALLRELVRSEAPLVAVIAPAGYGKTTLLAQWAETEPRDVAWLSLDRWHDDPAGLIAALTATLSEVSPSVADAAERIVAASADPLRRGAPTLAAVLRETPAAFVLLLDDVHHVASDSCGAVLDLIIAAIPPGSTVALASRHPLAFLARHRAQRRTREIGVCELRLDADGARTIAASVGASPPADVLRDWVARCEGWPTGLVLSALLFGNGTTAPHGADRAVADYLYRECLADLPEPLREFLLRTSALDQLTAEVCDAALDREDSARWLREITVRNLFIVRANGTAGAYRYHDLFREFLQDELRATAPAQAPVLHLRAAAWYEEHELIPQAIDHRFDAGDTEGAALLLAQHALAFYQRGEISLMLRWLERLGDAGLKRAPRTLVLAIWTALLQGLVPEAVRWLQLLETIDVQALGAQAPAVASQLMLLRAAMRTTTVAASLDETALVLAAESATSPWLDLALHLHGLMLLLGGDAAKAQPVLERAVDVSRTGGGVSGAMLSACELANLAIAEGDWHTARLHADAAVALVHERGLIHHGPSSLPMALSARIAARRGDERTARSVLRGAMRARERTSRLLPVLAVRARIHLVHAWVALGEFSEARTLMTEIDEILCHGADLGRLLADVEDARHAVQHPSPATGTDVPLTPAELRLIPYLQTHLTLAKISEKLFVSRNTIKSQTASVYRKLGVTERDAAVAAAERRGLLSGGAPLDA